MDWNDVRHFLTLARLGSVRAAGAALGVSHSTVARRVEALEAQLGARLFDRSAGGYALTAAGRELVPGAEQVEAGMAELERRVVGQDERLAGVVSVTCGDHFVAERIIAALTPWCAAHPAIELRVTTDGRPFDLSRREADLAVRALGRGVSPPEALLGAIVAPLHLGEYVAVAHAERLLGPPAGEAAAGGGGAPPRWLAFDDPPMVAGMIAGSSRPALGAWGTFNSIETILHAARAGLGLVMLPVYIGDGDPTLLRVPGATLRHLGDLWLLCHPDLRHTARIRSARATLAAAFAADRARFAGTLWPESAPGRPEVAPGSDAEGRLA